MMLRLVTSLAIALFLFQFLDTTEAGSKKHQGNHDQRDSDSSDSGRDAGGTTHVTKEKKGIVAMVWSFVVHRGSSATATAPVTSSAAPAAAADPDDGIGPITVKAHSNTLTVKLEAPQGKFNLVSLHMRLDQMITVPEQGTIASPDLKAPKDYSNGAFVWRGHVPGKTETDLKGKTIYYWVRVEENGLGKNGIPKQTTIA